MNTSIIAVGTELLFGQVVNTNAAYLSEKLNHMGFNVLYHHVVGDNPDRLRETIERALSESDLLLLTGGLGPTQDDLTKEITADVFGASLKLDEECLEEIREFFSMRGMEMSRNNIKQAYLPEGATVFRNEAGTAPAFAIEKDGKCAICFPGPPREMKWVFEHGAEQYLQNYMDKKMVYRIVRTIGIGESDLEMVLLPLIDGQVDPTIATYAKEGECTFRIASQRDTLEEAEAAVEEMLRKVRELVGDYIYSESDEELNEVVVRKLREKNLSLSSAESATGGLFAGSITDVPGASLVFERGYITYNNEAKISMLSVAEKTIDRFGVVSREVASEMARGARLAAGSDIAVSVTGFAGPDADEGFEAGLAYVGYAYEDQSGAIEIRTKRNERKWNRNYFRLTMLRAVNDILDRYY